MKINIGKTIRLGDLIDPTDHRSLVIDTSITASVGAVSGLENFKETVSKINTICDGIIVNPGQLEHYGELLGGSHRASPIVRLDWTNYYRDRSFCLPAKQIHRILISSVDDALTVGASATVVRYLIGMDDEFEAENVRSISLTAKDAYREALPLIVELCMVGEKVNDKNFDGAVKLGVACMLEVGADGLIIPECSPETTQEIGAWADIPVLLRSSEIPDLTMQNHVFNGGFSGILLRENIFSESGFAKKISNCFNNIHTKE